MDGLNFAHYGEVRGFVPTVEESDIFDLLCEISGEERLKFVKKSSNYVSAILGPMDVARFKFTKKAHWILFPYIRKDKIQIESPEDVRDLKDEINESIAFAKNNK